MNWQDSLWDLRERPPARTWIQERNLRLSPRLFLLSADDALHTLASAAFMRMLRQEDVARVPDFAGQRTRQASIVGRGSHQVQVELSSERQRIEGASDPQLPP